MLITRPKVAELTFQLFGRPLHPELFAVYKSRQIERGVFRAKLDITGAGHLITYNYHGYTLTEVATSANAPLPKRRRLMWHRLTGKRTDRIKCRNGVVYETCFQLEKLDPHIFRIFQEELLRDEQCKGMVYTFGLSGRAAVGAISYLNVETRIRSMLVQAFHTFPDDCAIVKSQTRFRLPD